MRPLQSVGSRLTVAAMTIVLGTPGLATADEAADGKDATYYISLGDSLASGYQPDVDKDTDVAYTDQLYTQLKQRTPGLKHIRLGCTAETTESLLKGGKCDYPNAKSQLDAALKAMTQHHGKVAYVTLSVGANDILLNCVSPGRHPRRGVPEQPEPDHGDQPRPDRLRAAQGGREGHPVRGLDVPQPVPGDLVAGRRGAAGRQGVGTSTRGRQHGDHPGLQVHRLQGSGPARDLLLKRLHDPGERTRRGRGRRRTWPRSAS